MDFVDINGTSKWSEFAKIVRTKNRFACRCRYSTIIKHLNRYPGAELKDVPRKDKSRLAKVNLSNYLEAASKLKAAREAPTKTLPNAEYFKTSNSKENINIPNKILSKSRLVSDKHGRQLCQFFKYAYNWQFTPERIPRLFSAEDTERTFTMLQLLDFELDLNRFQANFTHLSTEDQTNLTLALNVEPTSEMKDDIRYVKSFGNKFTVNLNTVLAWRAMQMMVAEKPLVKIERPQIGEYAGRYNLFMRRFKQIFYWTALLGKLDLRIVRERMVTKATKDDLQVLVENEPVYSDEDDGELLVEVCDPPQQEIYVESESDEENAVDFLLSHIKTKAESKKCEVTDQETAFDMLLEDFDFNDTVDESTVKSELPNKDKDKRKNESQRTNEFKKPKLATAAKSMPLT